MDIYSDRARWRAGKASKAMIPFFRKIRYQLARDNQFFKYSRYAIGEIFLVVIGILIALKINNMNEERIQSRELDDLLGSISSAIQSDVKYLNLIRTGRESIGNHVDSIFNAYVNQRVDYLSYDDYAYMGNTFNDLNSSIYFQPNTSSFEAIKNSIYLSKLQGTDIELLLHSYYASAERIERIEEEYNQSLKRDYQDWSNEFRNRGRDLLQTPWTFEETEDKLDRFLEVLNAEKTKALFSKGFEEFNMGPMYDIQILLGEKYIDMVKKDQKDFDEETRVQLSGILNTYDEVNTLNLIVNGNLSTNFAMIYAQHSNKYYPGIKFENDYVVLTYPEKTFLWGSPYFSIEALNGRVTEMDFTKYNKVVLEMKGAEGGEEFWLMMKDKYDPPDGTESRAEIKLTDTWQTYEVPTSEFQTADMEIIETPLGFVFIGDKGLEIHVRNIQFQ